jgi:DNA-binding NarL/FixJ family response regulator
VRVLLADDDPKVRSALRLLLENEPDMAIVGECATAEGLVDQVRATQASLVLLDWDLPGLHIGGVIHRLRTTFPRCCLLALSGRPEQAAEAVEAGLSGFVSKGDPPDSLLAALSQARCFER